MNSAHFTLHRAPYFALRAVTGPGWKVSERNLLETSGPSQATILDYETKRHDPVWENILEPPLDSLVLVRFPVAEGAKSINIRVGTAEPSQEADSWQIIQQGGVQFGYRPPLLNVYYDDLAPDVADAANAVVSSIGDGWHMVRVSVRNMHPDLVDKTEIQVDIWPVEQEAAEREFLKYEPSAGLASSDAATAASGTPSFWELRERFRNALAGLHLDEVSAVHEPMTNAEVKETTEFFTDRGFDLPAALVEWFILINRIALHGWSQLLPNYDALTAAEALQIRKQMITAWDMGAGAEHSATAGEPAYTFIPEYLPIAERDGYLLVADLRTGGRHGQILYFDKVDADDTETTWPSIAAFLTELVTSLETSTPFLDWTPRRSAENPQLLEWAYEP